MVEKLNTAEEEILLIPASYNKKGLLGDFQIRLKDKGILSPYTSIGEYFKYFNDAKYVYVTLNIAGKDLFYKITREDYKNNLEELESLIDLDNIIFI